MNINDRTLEKLKKAWEKADSLDVPAMIRIDDPAGGLSFYVLAIDPMDEDATISIVDSPLSLEVARIRASDIFALYDAEGRHAQIDRNWTPISGQILYKKLRGKHGL